jgi:hypothetical protein
MRKLAVADHITVDGVTDAGGGWFIPSGEEDVDQPELDEVLAS